MGVNRVLPYSGYNFVVLYWWVEISLALQVESTGKKW